MKIFKYPFLFYSLVGNCFEIIQFMISNAESYIVNRFYNFVLKYPKFSESFFYYYYLVYPYAPLVILFVLSLIYNIHWQNFLGNIDIISQIDWSFDQTHNSEFLEESKTNLTRLDRLSEGTNNMQASGSSGGSPQASHGTGGSHQGGGGPNHPQGGGPNHPQGGGPNHPQGGGPNHPQGAGPHESDNSYSNDGPRDPRYPRGCVSPFNNDCSCEDTIHLANFMAKHPESTMLDAGLDALVFTSKFDATTHPKYGKNFTSHAEYVYLNRIWYHVRYRTSPQGRKELGIASDVNGNMSQVITKDIHDYVFGLRRNYHPMRPLYSKNALRPGPPPCGPYILYPSELVPPALEYSRKRKRESS
jgi:hypothetical protein